MPAWGHSGHWICTGERGAKGQLDGWAGRAISRVFIGKEEWRERNALAIRYPSSLAPQHQELRRHLRGLISSLGKSLGLEKAQCSWAGLKFVPDPQWTPWIFIEIHLTSFVGVPNYFLNEDFLDDSRWPCLVILWYSICASCSKNSISIYWIFSFFTFI